MSASEFLAAFFDATSSASIYVCSLLNERDNGQSGEAKLVGRGDFAYIDTFVQRHDLAGRGTFFCVNTVQPKQSRRTKETIAEIVALHADIDLDNVACQPTRSDAGSRSCKCRPPGSSSRDMGFICTGS